jgi:tetratricopeptide (TPR) repeat protein
MTAHDDERAAFLRDYQAALKGVADNKSSIKHWNQLGHLLDGRDRNVENALFDRDELIALDKGNIVDWSQFIWRQILDREPSNPVALERLAEHLIEVDGDDEGAEPVVKKLRTVLPNNIHGLRFAMVLAANAGKEKAAQKLLQQILAASPAQAVEYGLFDYFDELDFLVGHVDGAIAAIVAMPEKTPYDDGLLEQLRALKKA